MDLRIYPTRKEMGEASAALAAETLLDLIMRDGRAVAVFASAVSQSQFLEALAADARIEWDKVIVFHMDEYIGIGPNHPASFRRFQHDYMWSRLKPGAFHELNGDARDVDEECARYADLLDREKPSLCFAGIGENGHLAFNDPPADFNDPQLVRVVELDEVCRMQQVHDGAFKNLEDVPRSAITLTVPALVRIPRLILNVPGTNKAEAVQKTVEGPVTPDCPASILQRHPNATLFVDQDAASLLKAHA